MRGLVLRQAIWPAAMILLMTVILPLNDRLRFRRVDDSWHIETDHVDVSSAWTPLVGSDHRHSAGGSGTGFHGGRGPAQSVRAASLSSGGVAWSATGADRLRCRMAMGLDGRPFCRLRIRRLPVHGIDR